MALRVLFSKEGTKGTKILGVMKFPGEKVYGRSSPAESWSVHLNPGILTWLTLALCCLLYPESSWEHQTKARMDTIELKASIAYVCLGREWKMSHISVKLYTELEKNTSWSSLAQGLTRHWQRITTTKLMENPNFPNFKKLHWTSQVIREAHWVHWTISIVVIVIMNVFYS